MLSFKQYIVEKRKNPEQNPKISTLQKIKKHVNRDDLYVSFRTINKLGINPNSKYNTPNGIYGYWLKSYRDMINDAKPLDEPNKVFPYMAKPRDTEHFYIFKAKEDANVVHLGLLDEDTVKDYIYAYLEKHSDIRMKFIDQGLLKQLKTYEQQLKTFDDHFKGDFSEEKIRNFVLKFPHLIVFNDYNNIPEEMKYQRDSLFKKIKSMKLTFPDFSDLDKFVDYVYKKGEEEAQVKTPGGIFWWFGFYLYEENSNKWNKFFRELGIDGVTDDKGRGIIHDNEPYQTVFFDGGKLKVVDSGFNKVYKQVYKFKGRKFEYELEDDVLVFYHVDVNFMELDSLKELPWVKQGKQYRATGNFDCSGNNLTTLEGSPKSVDGDFICHGNPRKFTKEEVRKFSDVKHYIYT